MSRWLQAFASLSDETRQLKDRGVWITGPSDLLGILGVPRRERYHMKILRWLLDPTAPHGFDTQILAGFLDLCFQDVSPPRTDLRRAVVRCDERRSRSEADLLIRLPGMTVVIEAKVDSPERDRQCDDLYDDFKGDLAPRFIFLTPSGSTPRTATGDAARCFVPLAFKRVRSLLEQHLARAGLWFEANDRLGLATVFSYLETMRRQFP